MRQPRYPTVDQAPTNRELREAVQTAADALTASDVGSAAYAESADFATAAQGAKADSAVQSVTGSAVDNTDPKNPVINSAGGGSDSAAIVLDADLVVSGTSYVDVGSVTLVAGVYAVEFCIVSVPSNSTGRFVTGVSFDNTTGVLFGQSTYGQPTFGNFYQYQFGIATSTTPSAVFGSPGSAGAGQNTTFGTGTLVLAETTTVLLQVRQAVASGSLTTKAGSFVEFRRLK